jgi:hypothetical protein
VESMLKSSKIPLMRTLRVSVLQRSWPNEPDDQSTLKNMDNAVPRDASKHPLMVVLTVPSHSKDFPSFNLTHWSRLWLQACRENTVELGDASQNLRQEKASSGEEEEEDCMMGVSPLL